MSRFIVNRYVTALVVIAGLPALSVTAANVDKLGDTATRLCDKIKSCAVAQLEQQQLTPEMRQMIAPSLEGMCKGVRTRVHEVKLDPAMQDAAIACMKTMASAGCEAFVDDQQKLPEACENYQDLVGRAMGSSN